MRSTAGVALVSLDPTLNPTPMTQTQDPAMLTPRFCMSASSRSTTVGVSSLQVTLRDFSSGTSTFNVDAVI